MQDRYYDNVMNGLKTNILTNRELENDSLDLDEFLENTAEDREHSWSCGR